MIAVVSWFNRTDTNGYRIYVDMLKAVNLSLLIWASFIGQFFSSRMRGGDGVKGVDSGDRYFSQMRVLLSQST